MSSILLNKAAVKKYTLQVTSEIRPAWGATRVSSEFYDWLGAAVAQLIYNAIRSHPSLGVTIQPPTKRTPSKNLDNDGS